ncbi:copper amine oxidase N-terminal domain-containing protein [Brevibacillus centrosporus]|uniref:copper amine oxidase N-terminal domain-containing protein n=1 Tax=Brevibacillus centrosporus TaxID=54910 RepID=UPI003D1DBD7B
MKKVILATIASLFVFAGSVHADPLIPGVDVSNTKEASGTKSIETKPLFSEKGHTTEVNMVSIVVNNVPIFFKNDNERPFIDKQGRTQVPVRFVSEALGKKVDWEGSTQTVTIAEKIKLRIKSSVVELGNGKTIHMDTVAQLKDDRTFVPVRFVAEALGQKVDWDEKAMTVIIQSPTGDGK